MAIDIRFCERVYFPFDKPVPYALKTGKVEIAPISLEDAELFEESAKILQIDKNATGEVEIIQMSYLQFICDVLAADSKWALACLGNLLLLCLGLKNPAIVRNDKGRPSICDDAAQVIITPKEFDDISRVILYQNLIHYDDTYISPDLKEAIAKTNEAKSRNMDMPNLERKMAIITAHCGISKHDQMVMTYRSHCRLWEEVIGEIDFTTTRNALLISRALSGSKGKAPEIEHWVYRKKKGKFEDYIVDVKTYTDSMGMNSGAIKQT